MEEGGDWKYADVICECNIIMRVGLVSASLHYGEHAPNRIGESLHGAVVKPSLSYQKLFRHVTSNPSLQSGPNSDSNPLTARHHENQPSCISTHSQSQAEEGGTNSTSTVSFRPTFHVM